MSYVPAIPQGGLSGWLFLKRTLPTQEAVYARSASVQREEAYFRERIGSIRTAEDLVSDRRLLKVALEAFGLGADINNRFFIQRVLGDGVTADTALSNRLADKRYQEMATAFGLGAGQTVQTGTSGFADRILAASRRDGFEQAVGTQDEALRLALQATRELPEIAAKDVSDTTKWLTILGNKPLRTVVEGALGLGSSFGSLDIDRQVAELQRRTQSVFGSDEAEIFNDPATVETLVRRYLALTDANGFAAASGSAAALQLLQAARQ